MIFFKNFTYSLAIFDAMLTDFSKDITVETFKVGFFVQVHRKFTRIFDTLHKKYHDFFVRNLLSDDHKKQDFANLQAFYL